MVSTKLPVDFVLHQNYPNPFNPVTTIGFALPHPAHVILKIYNIAGQEVATLVNEKLAAGRFKAPWNGAGFASGVYLYRFQAGDFVETRKLSLVK